MFVSNGVHKPFVSLVFLGCLICILFGDVFCHPQCLDYRPPFQTKRGLTFCHQYSRFGCCTRKQDTKIERRFQNLKTKFNLQNRAKCARLLKQVLCLECDPYAAHIFEAEGNKRFNIKTATPGLCYNFCNEFYHSCREVVSFMERKGKWLYRGKPSANPNTTTATPTQTKSTPTASNTAQQFCRNIQLQDMDYCYPDVKTVEERVLARKYNKDENRGCLCAEEVASGLRNPLAAVHSNDGTHRLFIAEQIGVIRVLLHTGKLLPAPFLDITTNKVMTSRNYADERGLLSIAFHPNYARNGKFYVYYSTFKNNKTKQVDDDEPFWGNGHKTVLSEYLVSSNPNRADVSSERVILEIPQPALNHNGGQILFGNDGYLYLTLGDGGKSGDPFGPVGNGQNRNTLLGSILSIDINTHDGSDYRIPRNNPFTGMVGVRPEIWAYGVRNMWRCSMDRGDKTTKEGRGRFFCGDVGQFKYEEIDIIERGGNYGWRGFEGYECYDDSLCYAPMLSNAISPIHVYNHTVGKSILGGYVYRGCQNPNLYGQYIFADTWSSRFFSLVENKRRRGRWESRELCFGDGKYCTDKMRGDFEQFVLSFGEDEAGELYIMATPSPEPHSPKGKLYRLIDPERRGDPVECQVQPKAPVARREERPTSPTPAPNRNAVPCEDRLTKEYKVNKNMCKKFKSRNMCSLSKFYKTFCRKTCGFCRPSRTQPTGPTPHRKAKPTPQRVKPCIDRLMIDYKIRRRSCWQYKRRGMCHKGRFYKKFCKRTCGFCT